jgi:hypothetical protein
VSTSKPELRLVPNATSVLSPNDAHALDIVLDAVFETICSLYEQDMLPSDVGQAIDTPRSAASSTSPKPNGSLMTLQGRATLARILTAAGVDFGWNGYPIA